MYTNGMLHVKRAKVFATGRSQAVRLPVEFRFSSNEVLIRRDHDTGDVILSEPKMTLQSLLETIKAVTHEERAEFLLDRDLPLPPKEMF